MSKDCIEKLTPQETAKTLYKVLNGACSIPKKQYVPFVNALLHSVHSRTGDGKPVTCSNENLKYGLFDFYFGFPVGKTTFCLMVDIRCDHVFLSLVNCSRETVAYRKLFISGKSIDYGIGLVPDIERGTYEKFPNAKPMVRKLINLIKALGDPTASSHGRKQGGDDLPHGPNKNPIGRTPEHEPSVTHAIADKYV